MRSSDASGRSSPCDRSSPTSPTTPPRPRSPILGSRPSRADDYAAMSIEISVLGRARAHRQRRTSPASTAALRPGVDGVVVDAPGASGHVPPGRLAPASGTMPTRSWPRSGARRACVRAPGRGERDARGTAQPSSSTPARGRPSAAESTPRGVAGLEAMHDGRAHVAYRRASVPLGNDPAVSPKEGRNDCRRGRRRRWRRLALALAAPDVRPGVGGALPPPHERLDPPGRRLLDRRLHDRPRGQPRPVRERTCTRCSTGSRTTSATSSGRSTASGRSGPSGSSSSRRSSPDAGASRATWRSRRSPHGSSAGSSAASSSSTSASRRASTS